VIFAGIDVGSTTVKVVLLEQEHVIKKALGRAGFKGHEVAEALLNRSLLETGYGKSNIGMCIATGYGRARVRVADKVVTEITCHARGAWALLQGCRFVIDIGGQDSKAIALDQNGRVIDFAMNDKCAAGTGRFLEVMAKALDFDLDSFSNIALTGMKNPVPISSICTVFAESEVIGQVNSGAPIEEISAGICMSVASRVAGMAGRLPIEEPILFTGGVSINEGVRKALEKRLGMKINFHELSQYAGALGAALIGADQR